ncbi:galactose-specific lectin nattectin isoform X2 [Amia ocellicauda]|uniref:galactose-specific lectin nattectin isoform X2 n=1 Tax=Amia ocellicauda TaxID=2972642 RepID=UPI003463EEEE
MDESDNYTSLHEYNDDSLKGKRPILPPANSLQVSGRQEPTPPCPNVSRQCTDGQGDPTLILQISDLETRYSSLCKEFKALGRNCSLTDKQIQQCQSCPDQWHHFSDSCFYFSRKKMDWPSAQTQCEDLGGRLVIVHTHQEHDYLQHEAKKLGGFDYHYWIGLSDLKTEGDWRWVDNTPVNLTYWADTEPDNHLSGGLHGEDCAVLNSHTRSWHDVPCEFLYPAICETSALTFTA